MSQTQENNISTEILEAVKNEILAAVDEKFDVEAVAQMVEQLDFSKKLNVSLQQSFQGLQAELRQKEQTIQYLLGRLNNLELDIALLKRTVVSPYPFPSGQPPVPQSMPMLVPTELQSQSSQKHRPPDFSKLRAMTVPEPTNKFVPPPKHVGEDKTFAEQ